MKPSFTIAANGDSALDIRFDAAPSEALSRRIIALEQAIRVREWDYVQDLIPAYQCLTICFDPLGCDRAKLISDLEILTWQQPARPPQPDKPSRLIRIPVCYEAEFAPDMSRVSEYTGLPADEIISRHCAPHYLVHMLGFSPGFLYLGGLDPALHCPRKETPAVSVHAGAVGIGGNQTGIYPQATPGGWQIIGRTPLKLFKPHGDHPFVAEPLDRVEFYPIDSRQFEQAEAEIRQVIALEWSP